MSLPTEFNKKPWNQDGYLYLFNEINDPDGRWRLTRESFHRILDIFELKKESISFDYFRFVIYNLLSIWIELRFYIFMEAFFKRSIFFRKKYTSFEEGRFLFDFGKTNLVNNFFLAKNNNTEFSTKSVEKINYFLDRKPSIITFVVSFSYIIEVVYWELVNLMLLEHYSERILKEKQKEVKISNFKIYKDRYSRIYDGMFKCYGKPYMNLDAELFDEIQQSIVIKEDFNRDWLESVEQDLKSFIAETLGNIHLRSLVQGPLRPEAKEQMAHFFLQQGILNYVGVPWTDLNYLLFAWDIMFTKTPQEYYKTVFPKGIKYDRIVKKSEYVSSSETVEFVAETPLKELEYDFSHVDSDKIEEWKFFLSRLPGEQKQQLNLMVSFRLDETFDKKLSQFIGHVQHPEILTDILMEGSKKWEYLTPKRLPDNINWERYDELFPGDD